MIEIKKLIGLKNTTVEEKVFQFLKKNKKNAFRPIEIIKKIDCNSPSVRGGLNQLIKKSKISKKRISSNCSYYYFNNKKVKK